MAKSRSFQALKIQKFGFKQSIKQKILSFYLTGFSFIFESGNSGF
jgi:hypothetical protein